jgi:nitroreductase
MDFILSRRSVRKFTKEPVAEEQVRQLLAAAMAAPSAGNQQPWHFVVIDDRRVLDQPPAFHPNSKMLYEAPLAIAVCADLTRDSHHGMWVQDCSAATENLLLAAHALGLGAVWLGIYPREERVGGLRKLLGLPEHVMPLSLVAVGHPGEHPPPAERFQESRIHRNHW